MSEKGKLLKVSLLFFLIIVLRDSMLYFWDIEVGSHGFSLYLFLIVIVFPVVIPLFCYFMAQYIGGRIKPERRIVAKILLWFILLPVLMPLSLASFLYPESYVFALELWLFYFPINLYLVVVCIAGCMLIIYEKIKGQTRLIIKY
ncbi:MAG: hypothetical protein QXN63_00975 [Candidatus Bathyarchaeia archaeon]